MRRFRTGVAVTLAAMLSVGVATVAPHAHADAATPPLCNPDTGGAANALTVDGWVNTPTTYTATTLPSSGPATSVVDTFFPAGSREFTGVALSDLLGVNAAGTASTVIKADDPGPQAPAQAQKNDLTRFSVMVTGSDCFQALFSLAELTAWAVPDVNSTVPPGINRPYKPILAYAQGNESGFPAAVTGSLGNNGFARMIIPTDAKGSRRVSNVVEITVLKPTADSNSIGTTTTPACTPAVASQSSSLTVDGWVNNPRSYNLTQLQALPKTTVLDPFVTTAGQKKYTGVALSDLLGFTAAGGPGPLLKPDNPGPQAPATQKNDLTRFAVMVTASDCFQALFSAAELSSWALNPGSASNPFNPVLAYAQGDESTGIGTPATTALSASQGFARMIIPTDAKGSRRVSNVVEIRVIEAPTPQVSWATPAPITSGSALTSAQLNATATVPGTFQYTPPLGTVLGSGAHQVSALFVPTPGSSYTVARAAQTIVVNTGPGLLQLCVQGQGAPATSMYASGDNPDGQNVSANFSALTTAAPTCTAPTTVPAGGWLASLTSRTGCTLFNCPPSFRSWSITTVPTNAAAPINNITDSTVHFNVADTSAVTTVVTAHFS